MSGQYLPSFRTAGAGIEVSITQLSSMLRTTLIVRGLARAIITVSTLTSFRWAGLTIFPHIAVGLSPTAIALVATTRPVTIVRVAVLPTSLPSTPRSFRIHLACFINFVSVLVVSDSVVVTGLFSNIPSITNFSRVARSLRRLVHTVRLGKGRSVEGTQPRCRIVFCSHCRFLIRVHNRPPWRRPFDIVR